MVALFVALMFIGFLLVDAIVQRVGRKSPAPGGPLGRFLRASTFLKDTLGLTRIPLLGVRVGADALVAHALGVAEKVVLPKLGEMVKAGQPLFQLERQGRGLIVPSSITGHVVALNPRLGKRPEFSCQGSLWFWLDLRNYPDSIGRSFGGMRSGRKRLTGSSGSSIVSGSFSPCKSRLI